MPVGDALHFRIHMEKQDIAVMDTINKKIKMLHPIKLNKNFILKILIMVKECQSKTRFYIRIAVTIQFATTFQLTGTTNRNVNNEDLV